MLTEDNCIKELKDGKVSLLMKLEGMKWCDRFEVVGKKAVILAVNSGYQPKVVVYESNKLVHTSTNEFMNHESVFIEGSKVYFPSEAKQELIEFDLDTFEEKALMQEVAMMTAAPGQRDFLAVSDAGFLQTREGNRELREVFPRMGDCDWTAVISVGCFAVLAGWSQFSLSDGSELPKSCNHFLLVFPQTLEVVNQANPLSMKWSQEGSTSFR